MGLQTPRACTLSHGLKLLAVYIAFWSVVPRSSEAIKIRASLPGYLSDKDQNDVLNMMHEVQTYLMSSIVEGNMYKPGVVALTSYTFPTGTRIIFRLAYWNLGTCNLGLGSEGLHDIVSVPGAYISSLAQRLLPNIESLVLRDMGIGSCTREGVSVDYFPDAYDDAVNSSADDPSYRQLQSSPGSPPRVPAARVNVSRTGKRTTGRKTLQIDTAARLRASATDSLPVTNPNTNIHSPTFPKDVDGDCDLPSLILMSGTGPAYDVMGVHGYSIMSQGDKIFSPSTRFVLELQFDCNLVLYDRVWSKSLWSSATIGAGASCFAGLTMAGDLAVFESSGTSLWRSQTACVPQTETEECWTDTILQVQDDGDLALYILATSFQLWSSHTVQCEGGCL